MWRDRARTLSPFAFYARLLGEDGGRRALLGAARSRSGRRDRRIPGAGARATSRREAPSLHAFLAEIEATDAAIKRDMEAESDGVRVMTVHAGKGLEAPIVFLPDTCSAPNGRHDPKLTRLAPAQARRPAAVCLGREGEPEDARRRGRADWRRARPQPASTAACSMSR